MTPLKAQVFVYRSGVGITQNICFQVGEIVHFSKMHHWLGDSQFNEKAASLVG